MKGHVKTQQWEELVSIARTGVAKDMAKDMKKCNMIFKYIKTHSSASQTCFLNIILASRESSGKRRTLTQKG